MRARGTVVAHATRQARSLDGGLGDFVRQVAGCPIVTLGQLLHPILEVTLAIQEEDMDLERESTSVKPTSA